MPRRNCRRKPTKMKFTEGVPSAYHMQTLLCTEYGGTTEIKSRNVRGT